MLFILQYRSRLLRRRDREVFEIVLFQGGQKWPPLFYDMEDRKMFKKIEINGKEESFKCSAATTILYKRLFGKSLQNEMVKMGTISKNALTLKEDLARLSEKYGLKNDDPDSENIISPEVKNAYQEELVTILSEQTDSIMKISEMTSELAPQMAYIMWLEANKPQRELFKELNEESYINWLSNFDSTALTAISGDLFDLWNGTSKTYSKLKNV